MSRLILAFARHGDYQQLANTPSAHQPFGLTQAGAEATAKIAQQFKTTLEQQQWQLIPKIDSSNMLRAWQTAEIYQQVIQQPKQLVRIDCFDALAERCVGSAANLTVEQITEIVATDPRYIDLPEGWKSDSQFCLPFQGAESLLDAGLRVAEHIQTQFKQLERQDLTQVKLMVGHGAAFRHAAYHLGVIDFERIKQISMHHAQAVFFEFHEDGHWSHIAGEWKQRHGDVEGID